MHGIITPDVASPHNLLNGMIVVIGGSKAFAIRVKPAIIWKDKGRNQIKTIKNTTPFYWGLGINCLLIIVSLLPQASVDGGNVLDNQSWFELLLTLIPGSLLMCYGIAPDSAPGKLGGMIYQFYRWVRAVKKQK